MCHTAKAIFDVLRPVFEALRLIMRSSKNGAKIECSFGCVAHSVVLLKPNVANIILFNFCEQKLV